MIPTSLKPFRLIVRVKNNRLIRLREELGLNLSAFAAAIGATASHISAIESFKGTVYSATYGWTKTAQRIADYHGVACEDLWPEEVRLVRRNVMTLEASREDVAKLGGQPFDELAGKELRERAAELLEKLPPKTRKMLAASLDEDATLGELGASIGRSRERARQIVNGGVRTLRSTMRGVVADETRGMLR